MSDPKGEDEATALMAQAEVWAERACGAFEAENWPDWRPGQADNLRWFVSHAIADALRASEAKGEARGLERAAQTVDQFFTTYFSGSPGGKVIDDLMAAIRSLLPTPGGEQKE